MTFARLARLALFVVPGLAGMCAAAVPGAPDIASDPRAAAPLQLVITARVAPDQRLTLRRVMQTEGLARYADLKADGILSDYRIFFSRYVDTENWDMMSLLSFPDEAAAQHWKEVEERTPAGLPPAALALAREVSTSPTDRLRAQSAHTPARRGESVFVFLPYDYMVSTDAYIQYVDAYVIPQAQGWLREGLLASYSMNIARYGSARFWASLLILEYRDDRALGRRDAVMAQVRRELAETNPEWKSVSENKKAVRIGRQYIIADELHAD